MEIKSEKDLSISRSTTQDNVVDQLRNLILNHYFEPGERLNQNALAEKLGVSRTPIREALLKLENEGLILFSPYKGASVTNFSIDDLDEIYTIRIGLEGIAARLAASRITELQIKKLEELLKEMKIIFGDSDRQSLLSLNRQFHTSIYIATKQERLISLINNYFDLAEVYRRIYVNINHFREDMVNHDKVIIALRARDSDTAEKLTRTHLQKTLNNLKAYLEANEDQGLLSEESKVSIG